MTLSASEIACNAVGLSADVSALVAVPQGDSCVACGAKLQQGDLVSPWSPKDSFTDYAALANANGQYVCQHCFVVMNEGDFTQRWLQTIFHATGCYQTASEDMRAHALLNPPPPPFVWVLGDQKVQHILWKAPVTLSHEAMFIKFGERTFFIRKTYLSNLFETLKAAIQEWNAGALKAWELEKTTHGKAVAGKAPKEYKTPFLELSRDCDSFLHGSLNTKFVEYGALNPDGIVSKAIELLQKATPGEIWALTSLLYAKEPCSPRLVASPDGYRFIKSADL